MSYGNVMGGKLKLKGGDLGSSKKKRPRVEAQLPEQEPSAQELAAAVEPSPNLIRGKTPSELKFEQAQARRQEKVVKKMSEKSHKQKLEDFNKYLSNLSEHHDIPKVGPG
eukprot:TRINITY_DN20693_c0_g1_i1.p1 TRINITY_DN20693_c0_g1~~TRINITY_DN20693_c0_g1_i1.p1  ORF type:complete len:110 (-),score=44.41 TRINITY_DN20693_c0_g1_i1:289-618(-)